MPVIISKILIGIMVLGAVLVGGSEVAQQTQKVADLTEQVNELEYSLSQTAESFGAVYTVAGQRYKLSGGGISTTATSVGLVSFTLPVSGDEITMTNFGEIGYATIEPGSANKKEFISFTGVTQDGSSAKATLTGVIRGLDFVWPYSASTSLALSHSGGSRLIISNPPVLYDEMAFLNNDASITGQWYYSSTSLPRMDYYVAPTEDQQLASKGYIDGVAIAGGAVATNTTVGLVEFATLAEMLGFTASGTGGYLVIGADYFHESSSASNLIPISQAGGKLEQGWLDLTQDWSLTGNVTLASTTINNTLDVAGTTTLATSTLAGDITITGNASVSGTFIVGGNEIEDNFIGLSDAPATYTSKWGYVPRVNTAADALEFVDIIESTSTATTAANYLISSESAASTTVAGTYTKLKEIKMTHGGSVMVSVQAKCEYTGGVSCAVAIYVDGVSNNILTADGVASYAIWEGIATGLSPGSVVQIYAKVTDAQTGWIEVKEFRIFGTGITKTNIVINTSTAQLIQE